jgi:hypothetical protein
MAHYVICYYCKEKFNRDKEPAVAISARRYAHTKCVEENEAQLSQEEKDLIELNKYVKELLKDNYNSTKVKKQIKEYKEKYNYSYSGILKSLIYFYEIKNNSIEKANGGIGIVPYIFEEAKLYYYNLYLAKNNIESSSNNIKEVQESKKEIQEVTIEAPKRFLNKIKLFKFLDMEE